MLGSKTNPLPRQAGTHAHKNKQTSKTSRWACGQTTKTSGRMPAFLVVLLVVGVAFCACTLLAIFRSMRLGSHVLPLEHARLALEHNTHAPALSRWVAQPLLRSSARHMRSLKRHLRSKKRDLRSDKDFVCAVRLAVLKKACGPKTKTPAVQKHGAPYLQIDLLGCVRNSASAIFTGSAARAPFRISELWKAAEPLTCRLTL